MRTVPQRKNGIVLQNCPNCGAVNSANAKTCYVCVSPLPARASAASDPPARGRRYASFPDEISASAETEMDTGAQIAHDILRGLQKRSKPKRAPMPKAVAIPVAEPEAAPKADPAQELAAAPAAIAPERPLAPPAPAREQVSERVATEEERETFLAAPVAPAPAQESERKAELEWPPAPLPEPEPAAPEPQESALLSSSSAREAESVSESLSEPEAAPPPSKTMEREEEAELVGVLAGSEELSQTRATVAEPVTHTAPPAPVASTATTETNRPPSPSRWGAVKPSVIASDDWRRELSSRVEAYRARSESAVQEPQSGLPFSEQTVEESETVAAEIPAEEPSPRASLRTTARQRAEAVEIVAIQPEFDFAPAEGEERPQAQLVPVAELADRRAAGLLDAAFVAAAYLGFLVVFSSLGGKISFGKMELVLFGITFFLFYVQYFALFTYFGGSTPGMIIRGLRVVSFDGSPPTSRQLLQRTFGYVVSAASLMLGFAWSLWDEDHLSWHDRMSHTYLTHAAPQNPAS